MATGPRRRFSSTAGCSSRNLSRSTLQPPIFRTICIRACVTPLHPPTIQASLYPSFSPSIQKISNVFSIGYFPYLWNILISRCLLRDSLNSEFGFALPRNVESQGRSIRFAFEFRRIRDRQGSRERVVLGASTLKDTLNGTGGGRGRRGGRPFSSGIVASLQSVFGFEGTLNIFTLIYIHI